MKTAAFDAALRLVKHFEGFRADAYQDPAGIWTIGYGETGARALSGATTTEPDAERWLSNRLLNVATRIGKLVDVGLLPFQVAALLSFIYNVGDAAFAKSTLRKLINAGNFDGAADEFKRWNKAGGRTLAGLTKRRDVEARLFRGEELDAILGFKP